MTKPTTKSNIMKKVLITSIVLMVALPGKTEATTYKTSDYAGRSLTLNKTGDTIIVDSIDSLASISAERCECTFIFEGSNQLVCSGNCNFKYGSNLNLTATASAAEHWIDVFSQEGGGDITLAPKSNQYEPGEILIQGLAKGSQITLVGTTKKTTLTYVGRFNTDVKKIGAGEIAWKNDYNTSSLHLVAMLDSAPLPVPEPTTGSLSLLALAALAARRRRK